MGNNSANNKTTSPPTEVNAADWPSIEAADVPPSKTNSADWSSVEPPEVPPPEVVDDSPSPSKMALEEAEKQPNERKDNCVVREKCPCRPCKKCQNEISYSYGQIRFPKSKIKWLMSHEGYKETPYYPGEDSGITLGYGYDLGHQTASQAKKDLAKYYKPKEVKRLLKVVGKTRGDALRSLPQVKDIKITQKSAERMLIDESIPRYARKTLKIFNINLHCLHPYCHAALVSLVYNRGESLRGSRRKEMKNIANHLKNQEFDKIPKEFRDMKRLWVNNPNVRGLLGRRDDEADLFQQGLDIHKGH